MSLLDLASLVLAPTATKEGKVYSAIPDTGEGDMTFTRGSSATRVNSAGLIEKERANLLLQSNSFDTTWTNSGSTETGGQSGYDGSSDAWLLQSTTNGNAYLRQTYTNSGVQTFSFYAKAGNVNFVQVYVTGADSSHYFNLSAGTAETPTGGGKIISNITSLGSGWYRCECIYQGSSTGANIYIRDAVNGTASIGDNILIQDAMLNVGLVAQPYIPTTTTAVYEGITDDVPRVDYSGGGCPALKLEPQRTNLITQSEYFGAWTNDTNISLTANAIQSPSGLIDAYKISAGTSTARQAIKLLLTPSGDVVQSVFAKKGEYSVVQITDGRNPNLYANFDLENGVLGNYEDCTPSIEKFSDGWYRCVIVYNSTLDIVNTRISIAESPTQARLVNFAGNGSDGIYIWGAMVEAGSYRTSYLPTYGTSTTRAVDIVDGAVDASLFNDSEGVLFVEFAALADTRDNDFRFLICDGTNNERIQIFLPTSNILNVDCIVSNSATANLTYTLTNPSSSHKVAFKYKNNDFALWVDGVERGTDTSGGTPSGLDRLDFYRTPNNNNYVEANVKQAIYFGTALTDTQLQELTK
jgi:hypothetical protein